MKRRAGILYLAGLVFFLSLIYLPFMFYTVNADHDVQAMLGQIKATSEFYGWPNGFYINSILTGVFNRILNGLHLAGNDLLAAYKLVIFFSLLGIGVYTYLITHEITKKPFFSFMTALLIGIMPGITGLLFIFEDNIISSFIHIQFVYFYILLVAAYRREYPSHGMWRINTFYMLSFLFAILGHRQLGIVIVTPLFLYFFLPELGRTRRLLIIFRTYLVVAAMFVSAYVFLTVKWDTQFTVGKLCHYIHDWFTPSSYYRQFYFFNQFGWDIQRQAVEIAKGVSQIFSVEPGNAYWLALCYGLAGLLLVYAVGFKSFLQPVYNRILLLFAVIHIPHSLIYESSNLERWDVLVPVLGILAGLMYHDFVAKQDRSNADGKRMIILKALAAVIIAYNCYSYAHFLGRLNRFHQRPDISDLVCRLNAGVQYENMNRKNVLLLNPAEFVEFFMPAQVCYSYKDSLFGLSPNGEIYQSTNVYLAARKVLPEEFRKAIQGANLVFSCKDDAVVDSFLRDITARRAGR